MALVLYLIFLLPLTFRSSPFLPRGCTHVNHICGSAVRSNSRSGEAAANKFLWLSQKTSFVATVLWIFLSIKIVFCRKKQQNYATICMYYSVQKGDSPHSRKIPQKTSVLKVTWLSPSQEIHSNFCGTVRVTAVRKQIHSPACYQVSHELIPHLSQKFN